MNRVLGALRGLGLLLFGLGVVVTPIGTALFASVVVFGYRGGGGGFGDLIIGILGAFGLIVGSSALLLGGGIAVLAKRARAAGVDFGGPRRAALAGGLVICAGELAIAVALASQVPTGFAAAVVSGVSASFAAAYVTVGAASAGRPERGLAALIATALIVVSAASSAILARPGVGPITG